MKENNNCQKEGYSQECSDLKKLMRTVDLVIRSKVSLLREISMWRTFNTMLLTKYVRHTATIMLF